MNEIILKRIGALLSVQKHCDTCADGGIRVLSRYEADQSGIHGRLYVVIAFYFGTQTQKISDAVESKGAQ